MNSWIMIFIRLLSPVSHFPVIFVNISCFRYKPVCYGIFSSLNSSLYTFMVVVLFKFAEMQKIFIWRSLGRSLKYNHTALSWCLIDVAMFQCEFTIFNRYIYNLSEWSINHIPVFFHAFLYNSIRWVSGSWKFWVMALLYIL